MTDEANEANEERRASEAREPARASNVSGAGTDGGDAMLEALWARVDAAWDDDKPHHALLEYAITSQRLPDVAGRYRAVKESNPERAARAQKKLDGIVIAATQMLMAMKTPADQTSPSRALTLGVAVASIVVIVWLAFTWLRHAR